MKKISVLLPFRNAASTLHRAIHSILNQTFSDFELILINDGSTDNSVPIVKKIQDHRIKLINLSPSGIVKALNFGLTWCSTKYVARMDADDYAYPDRLEKQFQFLESHPEIDIVGSQVRYMGDKELNIGFNHYIEWNNRLLSHKEMFLNRFVESPIIHPTIMMRFLLVKKFGAYVDGPFPEDYELWLRLMQEGIQFSKIDEILLDWYDDPNRLSRTGTRYSTDAFYILKSKYLATWLKTQFNHLPPVLVWGTGKSVHQKSKWLTKNDINISGYIDVTDKKNGIFNNKPVIYYQDLPKYNFILSYVSDRFGRIKIREYLLRQRFKEGKDFYMMA